MRMFETFTCSLVAAIAVIIMVGALLLPDIHSWEVNNDYPLGRMCDVYNTCQ